MGTRVATYHPPQNSLTFPWFFPDILQFSIPSDSKKNIFILCFNSANCITLNLGVLLKERICSPREQILFFKSSPQWARREMGLDYLWESRAFPLLNRINFLKTACHSHFFFKFPDFSLTYQVLSIFPWPSTKFPDFSLTWKISFSRYFSLTVATLGTQVS